MIAVDARTALANLNRGNLGARNSERMGSDVARLLLRFQDLVRGQSRGDQQTPSIDVLDRHGSAQIRSIAAMLVDRQVMHGLAEECLLIDHHFRLAVNMEAQHSLLNQVFSILARSALALQKG